MRILVPYPSSFGDISNTSILFKKLIPEIEKKSKVTILWVNYQPEKLEKLPKSDYFTSLDLHNYSNAIDLLKKEKPDLIFAPPYEGFIDMSFSFAGKKLNIPVFTMIYYDLTSSTQKTISKNSLFQSYLKRISSPTVPSETHQYKKSKFRRGKFIFYKFSFLVKTLIGCKFNIIKIIKILYMILKFYISPPTQIDSRLAVDMHFVQNETIRKDFLKSNIQNSKIKVTGHPMFDEFLNKDHVIVTQNESKKIRILLAPISFYEYGNWTKEQSDSILTQIIKEIISDNKSYSLIVKLHPTAALLDEYKKIIHSIDPSIQIFQSGSIEDYLHETDVFISYYSLSTASMYALFYRIPIVICNFFNFDDDEMINRGLALECKEPSFLINKLENIVKNNPATEKKINAYVNRFFYKSDGKSAKRISDSLFELLETKK